MLLIAHRGSSAVAPENTLAAFRRAVRDGADMIELDVRLSADGELMVIHDRGLYRVTRVRGRVRERTAEELERLTVGSPRGRASAPGRIPRLATVLRTLPPAIGLNIEVKTDGDRRRSELVVHRLGELLRGRRGDREILVSSFDHLFLRAFHRRFPAIALAVLYLRVRDLGRSPAVLARRAGAKVFICSRSQLRRRWVRKARAGGIRVIIYGVDTLHHLSAVRRQGVDGVITDHPARLRRAMSMDTKPTTKP